MIGKLICLIIGHSYSYNIHTCKYGIMETLCKRCGIPENEGE